MRRGFEFNKAGEIVRPSTRAVRRGDDRIGWFVLVPGKPGSACSICLQGSIDDVSGRPECRVYTHFRGV